jgi:hypothetical protein
VVPQYRSLIPARLWVERGSVGIGAGRLRALDLKIDYDGVLTAPYHDSLAGLVRQCVDLLVRHVWRNIDEVARAGFAFEFKMISPPHASAAANNIEDGFQVAVMVRSRLRVWLDHDGASPELARSGSSVGDGGCPCHARGLRRVGVQIAGWNDFDAVVLPIHALHDNRFFIGRRAQSRNHRPLHGGSSATRLCGGWTSTQTPAGLRQLHETAPTRVVSGVAVQLSRFANRQLFRHPLQVAVGYPSGRCHQGCLRGFLKIGHPREP